MPRQGLSSRDTQRGKRLGQKIQTARRKRGLTQIRVAELARVPIDTYRAVEAGRIAGPSFFLIASIAAALQVDLRGFSDDR